MRRRGLRINKFIVESLLAACIVLAFSVSAQCKTIYVRVDGNDSNDGSTWSLAKKTVGAGITGAVPGDEIWVAAGTYVQGITLPAGVELYGGFVGNETARGQRDPGTNITTLDGNSSGPVVTCSSGSGSGAIIDGFTIQNGRGSGVICSGSSPKITNNTIKGNVATGYGYTFGAGIYCTNSSAIISSNMISGNVAGSGGGIFCSNSPATISNNTISDNAALSGGGIHCDGSSPAISNNTIAWNTANGGPGGGIYCSGNAASSVTNNTIAGNLSGQDGGGIYFYGATGQIFNNIVTFNSSGIYILSASTTLRNNDVYNPYGYNYSGISAGAGDISADPVFVDAKHGDLHIQPGSPCINAGWNAAAGIGSLDIDGQARVQPAGGTVDIGSDESDGTVRPLPALVVVRVDGANGSDSNDGSSWPLAKKTVQSAIDAASTSISGGEVWVKAGVYNEQIALKLHVYVYGGFAGTESARDTRNWALNNTVLDGGGVGSVVTATMPGRLLSIDGFTIRNAKWSGISCTNSSPTISHNTITANRATNGGGVCCTSSSPTIADNIISGNGAMYGGGIYTTYSSALILNNTIVGNSGADGGGIYTSFAS